MERKEEEEQEKLREEQAELAAEASGGIGGPLDALSGGSAPIPDNGIRVVRKKK